MTTHEASSSSSSKSKHWNYDVFMSFSDVDTRDGFTGHLHAALIDRGYQAYIDEDNLKSGEEMKEELFRVIEEARISIIVFSKRYADSSWCLDELVKIMECRYKLGQCVLPIFYHVDPSHVRKQNGDLAEAFQKHEEGIREEKDDEERKAKQERVKQWRKALTEAADLYGPLLPDNGREAKLSREIVDKIIPKRLLSVEELHVAKHPVGIYNRIQDIITYLSNGGSDDVRMVGIWGMGGLGKTTAAKAIYNQIHQKFQFKSFLANVSEYDPVNLQGKLFSDILKQTESMITSVHRDISLLFSDILKPTGSMITSVHQDISLIKNSLQRRCVLVIIDNVDKMEQLNAIAGNHHWFGPGSRIIITTRDERLLKQANMEVDKTYRLKEMNKEEALELFSWLAFGKNRPDEGYLELSKEIVSYCGGLPLALEVLGSFMKERTLTEMKSQLHKLKKKFDEGIMKSPRASEEALTHTEGDKILPFLNKFFDGGTNARRIGKLVISSTEISKGSNGTIVLEGVYEGRPVAVKRLVLAHFETALKKIRNLMASDGHPNIVRGYGVDRDEDFVYISLERCNCNLDDLIQICLNSSQNRVAGEEVAKRARIENEVRLKSLKNSMLDVDLWTVDGFPSPLLLKLMRHVVSGLVHLHEMEIIHRNLKPQNVLLIKKRTLCAKLSDMSSLGDLATGCGSSGWQAPEQLRNERQTRAVDMFSLGCLLFYCITGGTHPFGDQLERDINIVRNQMNLSLVEHIPEAADLISRLLNPDPEIRPKSSEVLLHPLFWNSETRLSFLRESSDRVEFKKSVADSSDRVELEKRVADSAVLSALERIAPIALGGEWDEKIESEFLKDIVSYRRYKFYSVQDLLRVIRNKSNHYEDIPTEIQQRVGPFPEGFYFYFASRFPRLLIEVYKVVCQNYREEERFRRYFKSNAD